MPKYTQDGLPVITKEIYESYFSLLKREIIKKDIVSSDFEERLREENPLLYNTLEQIVKECGKCEFSDGVSFGFFFVYEILRNQSAANKLNESI